MERKARSTLAQSGRLESQKISGGGRSVFLDFSFYRTSRDLGRVVTWCGGRGLLTVCRQTWSYSAIHLKCIALLGQVAKNGKFQAGCFPQAVGSIVRSAVCLIS